MGDISIVNGHISYLYLGGAPPCMIIHHSHEYIGVSNIIIWGYEWMWVDDHSHEYIYIYILSMSSHHYDDHEHTIILRSYVFICHVCIYIYHYWLVVWNIWIIFSFIGFLIFKSSQLTNSYFSEGWLNHQPDYHYYIYTSWLLFLLLCLSK